MLLWNTVEMSRQRRARSSSSVRWVMSVPSKVIEPPLMPARPLQQPQQRDAERRLAASPDSPIRPTNSPGSMREADVADGVERGVPPWARTGR